MAEGNGHGLTIDEFLQKHPVEQRAWKVELESGGHAYFRRSTYAELRALSIAQDRGSPEQAARADVEHLARVWCLDEKGTPALSGPDGRKQIHELARRDVDAVTELIQAMQSVESASIEEESKN